MHPPLIGAGVDDLLEQDPRPSFIVALVDSRGNYHPSVAYTNPALRRFPTLVEVTKSPKEKHAKLWEWVTSQQSGWAPKGTATSTTLSYLNVWWTRTVVMHKWVIVGANEQSPTAEPPRKVRLDSQEGALAVNGGGIAPSSKGIANSASPVSALAKHETKLARSTPAAPDIAQNLRRSTTEPSWIVPEFVPGQAPFLDAIEKVAWAKTPIGPMNRWPERLQQNFNQIVADSRPVAIYWGPSYTVIYNEAFSKLCGSRHPWMLGKSVDVVWHEAGRQLKEIMRTTAQKQRPSMEDEWRIFIDREDGGSEETYLKWSIIPVMENSECLGFIHPVLETTSMRLWERRMKMLIDLGDVLVTARDVKSYWEKTIEALDVEESCYDIPLAILYSVEDDPDAASDVAGSYDSSKICRLEGSFGVPKGHPICPDTLVLRHSDAGLAPLFREAVRSRTLNLVQTKDGTLPELLLRGLQWRGFGDPCSEAIIIPIRPTKEENVMALIFIGLNPRRPYDNDYLQFTSLLSQKLTTSLASTVLLEEEARRGRNAAEQAAFDQEILRERLAMQTKETVESVQKFEAVAEFIPVGMCFGDLHGGITFANDAWYRITGYPHHPGGLVESGDFLSCVVEEDRPNIVRAYEELKQESRNVTFEFRVKNRTGVADSANPSNIEKAGLDLVGLDPIMSERHVLASAKAERASDGSIIRVLTCLTDVTLHRRTAEEAVRRAQQAENLRRMAEFATVGMYDMALDGRLLGANKIFFEMCGFEKVDPTKVVIKPWERAVVEEDLEVLAQCMSKLVSEGLSQTAEIRFKKPWNAVDSAGNKINAPRWVQATFMPVKDSDGIIESFTGCLSDVSLQKWQLESERQRKEEAIESRRQQENFIDMTSHEMRNPLSAIVHCADAVIASLTKFQELTHTMSPRPLTAPATDSPLVVGSPDSTTVRSVGDQLIDSSVENTETIIACTQHQRRVVDDILTMSKLDSKLLTIAPVTCNPVHIAQEALKMFDVEARRVDINLSMAVDQSYSELDIEFLDFDPSRIKQILINLLTNALKFTKSGAIRNVTVTLSATKAKPTDSGSAVQFIPRIEAIGDPVWPPAGERGDPVYLTFEVKDTGQGLTEDEMKSLFKRFVQASSRTHVKYGGSGLGLFISRRLTEMQNGAIGVASLPGIGSTFAFYIEAYRPAQAALDEARATAAATTSAIAHLNTALLGNRIRPRNPITNSPAQLPQVDVSEIRGILVVEDNLINQQITRKGLADRGFTVDVANHGLEALDKLSESDRCDEGKQPLSLILMDIEMPVQDGLTCTKRIRELESQGKIRGGRIPIIAVSANARMEQILEAKAAGCDDVLVKPYRMPELIDKMRIVVQRVWEESKEHEGTPL